MRVYLAVAMLVLAFVAYTEAQADAEELTMEQKFANFGEQVVAMGRDVADKARAGFDEFKTSKFAVQTQSWVQEQIDSLKARFGETGQ